MEIELYNNQLVERAENGTLTLSVSTRDEAKQAVAYVWGVSEGVSQLEEQTNWDRGDILHQIRVRFSDLDIGEVIENSQKNYKTAYRLLKTSESWPPEFRDLGQSHSVHAEIALTKGLEADEMVRILKVAGEHDLPTAKVRQICKHVSRAENGDAVLAEVEGCGCVDDITDLMDSDRSSRMRYLMIGEHFLEGFTALPEHRSGMTRIDLKSRTLIDEHGEPHAIPMND